jgi:hypothetical protein
MPRQRNKHTGQTSHQQDDNWIASTCEDAVQEVIEQTYDNTQQKEYPKCRLEIPIAPGWVALQVRAIQCGSTRYTQLCSGNPACIVKHKLFGCIAAYKKRISHSCANQCSCQVSTHTIVCS